MKPILEENKSLRRALARLGFNPDAVIRASAGPSDFWLSQTLGSVRCTLSDEPGSGEDDPRVHAAVQAVFSDLRRPAAAA